jgi:hypothetical protein
MYAHLIQRVIILRNFALKFLSLKQVFIWKKVFKFLKTVSSAK